jgi:hypothetical protein
MIVPKPVTWFLDEYKKKQRKKPCIRISRRQFPLTTGDAATINSVQGWTEDDGIMVSFPNKPHDDSEFFTNNPAIAAYVALSRTRTHTKALVMGPFPKEVFNAKTDLIENTNPNAI